MILNDGFSTKLYDTPISSRFFYTLPLQALHRQNPATKTYKLPIYISDEIPLEASFLDR
jgi:hypothetical protein